MKKEKKESVTLQQLFQYLAKITRPFRSYLILIFFLVAFESIILAYSLPKTIERIADITKNASHNAMLFDALQWPLFLLFLWQGILEVNSRVQDYFYSIRTIPSLSKKIYQNQVSKLLDQSYQFYQENPPGALSNNLHLLANTIPEILDSLLFKITSFVLTFFVAIISLMCISTFAGICLIVYVIFLICVVSFFNKRINMLTGKWTKKRSKVIARIMDMVVGILTIKLFSSKKKETQALDGLLTTTLKTEKKVENTYLKMFIALGFGYIALQGLSVSYLLKQVSLSLISIGQLLGILYLNETVVSLVWDDLPDLLQFSKQVGKIRQVLTLECESTKVQDKPNAKEIVLQEGHIQFERVTFAFSENEAPFFNNFSLDIPPGQKVGIVGYAGSGKSTLIKLLLRLYDIQDGAIRIDGQNIQDVTQDSLRKQIGLIPQEITLLQRSLRENLQYSEEEIDDETIMQATKKAAIHDFISSMQEGYDTVVGKGSIAPSGGERQRFGVARLLLKNPKVVLLDEATSNMDAITEKSMQSVLNEFCEGKTTLIIAHRLSTLLEVDRIVVIKNGRIVEDGTHHELLNKKGLYAYFWNTQSDGFIVTEEAP